MNTIIIERLTKRYGKAVGVECLDLSVPKGAVFGFLGPNGSGKTTTIRVLLGLLRPSEGGARVFGRDCWRESHLIKSEVGYLPGDLRLYPWLTCRNALRVFGGIRRREVTKSGLELAEQFSLDRDIPVRKMSRGMRQKLGLILALAHCPELLVLDEPTASLDPLMQEKLYPHLRALASAGHTIFLSSHVMSEIEHLCDRVAILREGRLVAEDSLDVLRAKAKRVVTIVWGDGVEVDLLTPPQFLDVFERDGRRWRGELLGSAMDLVRWSVDKPIADLAVGQPDLARVFQEYYR